MLKILPVLKTNKDVRDYCICGPEELRNVALQALKQHGVEDEHIRFERFTFDDNQPIGKLHSVDISLANGTKHSIEVASNQSLKSLINGAFRYHMHAVLGPAVPVNLSSKEIASSLQILIPG